MNAKKFLSVLLAAAIVMSLGTTAFAASNVPSDNDLATVTIKGVENGANVTLYKIVEPIYNDAGLENYQPVVENSIADVKAPTTAEIAALAQMATSGLSTLVPILATQVGNDYEKDNLGAGMYLVLVEGTGSTVYNPMIVSLNYDKDSVIEDGEVDAQSNWVLGDTTAYAKSGTPGVDKMILDSDGNSKGNDVAIGDTVKFEIDTKIPSYSEQYVSPKFDIRDTLSTGFDTPTDVVVKVDGATVTTANNTYSLTVNGSGILISFAESFIRANGGKVVAITYSAEVNENAELNYNKNTNTATIIFSNDPTDSTSYGTEDDETYTYTFAIDGILGGTTTTGSYKTHELIKVYEDGRVDVISQTTDPLDTIEVTNPLAGAVFTLTNKLTGKTYSATSDDKGYLAGFNGLDAGTYKLVETTAPTGYVADTTEHEVVISASYNPNGTLSFYTITIDGNTTSTYAAIYDNATPVITEIEGSQTTLTVENSKIPTLPSTGGIGTTIFYVLGSILIIGAGIMLVTKKRMNTKI